MWTRLKWRAAGAELTLDQIEHDILRPVFKQPLVHFALSCGSVSCPALAAEPDVADRLLTQLGDATRGYLASEHGLRAGGDRLDVSSLFIWYADDFVAEYARLVPGTRSEQERAVSSCRGALRSRGAIRAGQDTWRTAGLSRLQLVVERSTRRHDRLTIRSETPVQIRLGGDEAEGRPRRSLDDPFEDLPRLRAGRQL